MNGLINGRNELQTFIIQFNHIQADDQYQTSDHHIQIDFWRLLKSHSLKGKIYSTAKLETSVTLNHVHLNLSQNI